MGKELRKNRAAPFIVSCYQRTIYAPILTRTSMERPYRFGTDHARFRQVANLLRREASVTGCVVSGCYFSDLTPVERIRHDHNVVVLFHSTTLEG